MDWLRAAIIAACIVFATFPELAIAQQSSQAEISPESLRVREIPVRTDGDQPLSNLEETIEGDSPLPSKLGPRSLYALGRMYKARGQTRRALDLWRKGLDTGHISDSVHISIADAFLRAVTEETIDRHMATATRAYRSILAHAGSGPNPLADSIVDRHVAQLVPILPASTEQSLVQGSTDEPPETWTFKADAGEQLQRWWRRHDPLPATEKNERMRKHLQRTAHAREHFACGSDDCSPAGWDDRGTVYVRFGPPGRRDSITYNDMEFNLDVFRFGVPVSGSDFPENEFWRYPHIHDSGRYLFAEEGEGYRVAKTNDLLPHQLQTGYGGRRERSLNKAVSAMAALRHIYEKLSMYDNGYAKRYADIDFYASWQEEQAALVRMGVLSDSRVRTVGSGAGQKRAVGPGPGADPRLPNEYVSDMIQESKARDQLAARRRRDNMPTHYGGRGAPSLPVALRTARFLTDAGSTEVQVAWSHPAHAFSLPEDTRSQLGDHRAGTFDGHFVQLRGVTYDSTYHRSSTSTRKYLVEGRASDRRGRLNTQTLSMSGDEELFHARLQWDHYVVLNRSGTRIQRGPLTRRSVKRVDSIEALPADGRSLTMSDLMPGRLQDGEAPRKENLEPYPFSSLSSDAQITLYFELYNLALDGDRKSKYTIEYSVTQASGGGGVFGLFGGDERTETQTRFTYQGRSSRVEELIKLDLEKWDDIGNQPLTIAVRVTDEISGKQAERTIRFSAPK